ncbi:MAG: cyclic nucleotide-binding domain-containing protein [Deltaproteobacteria bacterium]|nr:cyclic nucleotide-binding domain-containing protein [Deltaproteobacteria bacterium]
METFGRYQLLRRVAVGGMAEIFLARSAGLDGFEKDLVIKRIRPDYSADEKFSSMFIDEAKISISLTHQNIVQVFDFGQVDGAYYLAMEHVHGCDLDQLMDLGSVQGEGLEPGLALFIMSEATHGLDYAHNKKGRRGEPLHLVHRDISPQNIMVSVDGGVKLTDFGIAKAKGRTSHTDPGIVLGKMAYMAPEHATGKEVDQHADIFACGVVLWELLVGDAAYAGELGFELYQRIRDADIPPPSSRNQKLDPELDALVLRAVAADPSQRYQSARELWEAIQDYRTRKHPRTGPYELQAFIEAERASLGIVGFEDLDRPPEATPVLIVEEPSSRPTPTAISVPLVLAPLVAARAATVPAPATPAAESTAAPAPTFDWTPGLIDVIEAFRHAPSLWHLMKMGALCADLREDQAAVACYRVAAVKFAQRGLLAQALLCCRRILRHRPFEDVRPEMVRLPSFCGLPDAGVAPYLFASHGPVEDLLAELLADANPGHGVVGAGTPLLHHLRGEAFADLAFMAPHRFFEPDETIIVQGSAGRTMYLIAGGRVLVHAEKANGERAYLSSLTAGDFVGENGFFTGAPRSATVTALYPVEAFEIDPELFSRLMGQESSAQAVLLKFYKERIVDVVLAKSPVFGLLENEDRRALIDRFDLRAVEAGTTIIREGEMSDQIYLIKDGSAEVWSGQGDGKRLLSTLGPGTLFGEVAALRRIARTASVVAASRVEALSLEGADFQALLDAKPDLRRKVLDVVATRVRENLDKLVGLRPPPSA